MAPGFSTKQIPRGVSFPPLDGSLYLPEMVEFNSKHNPTHPFYTFHDEHYNKLRSISHLEFYRASQRIAHAVRPYRKGSDNEVVAIIANCDTVLFQASMLGVMFAGLIPFPMSPRNSRTAVLSMMRKSGCRRLMATRHSLGPLLDNITAEAPELLVEDLPTVAYAYPELGEETDSSPFIPYPKAEARPLKDDISHYLHSSGSTGIPKPIPISNITVVHCCLSPSVQDHVNLPRHITIGAASLPPFHMMGVLMQIIFPVASLNSVAVFSPTSYHDSSKAPIIPNSQNSIEVLQTTQSNSTIVVPAFLEEWATSAQALDVLKSLEYVAFGGGPLSKKSGDALVAAGVRLSSAYGGTEFGPLTYVLRDPIEQQLWEWVRFGPNQNIRWVPQGDGTYECQVLASPTHQLSLENLSDVRGYATSDVFVKHPTIEGLYKIVGRLDDVLIHSSGEKTVPAPMENIIGASPILSGVCIFGRGRNQTGVLVEPRPEFAIDVTDDQQLAEFRNGIWREIEEANKEAPAFSRIFKEMILVTGKEKPMLRAGKGTVAKKATMKLYESEIDALYTTVEASARAGVDVPLPQTWSQSDIERWLMVHATAVNADKPIKVDVDVFEQGFDSLSSTFLRNRIIGSLAASSHETIQAAVSRVSQNVIFANPTIQLLSKHLIQLLGGEDASASPASDPKTGIEDMVAKYSVGLGGKVDDGAPRRFHGLHAVLLTGSTGGRAHRQRAAFEDRGLDTSLLDSGKLVYIEGDAARQNLSLEDRTYAEIRDSITMIIHNAWRLDFNLALSSFEPNVRGTRHLIDLALTSRWATKPRFLFTSSVASAQGWDKSRGAFPEEVQYDAGVAVGSGYGASKYASERVIVMSGLSGTTFRIGQITGGAPRGAWSTSDWVPIIVKSSVSLGALPEAQGVISWLPPHAVSDTILDVGFAREEPPTVVNLVHPQPSEWKFIMRPISDILYQKHLTPSPLPLIPFTEWMGRLEQVANTNEGDAKRVPAIKLLGFMRAMAQGDAAIRRQSSSSEGVPQDIEAAGSPRFATDVARRVSETLRRLEPISAVDAEQWIDYWASAGLFDARVERPAGV